MALNKDQRSKVIDYLVANCDCWKSAGDREILDNLADEKLEQLKAAAEREQQIVTVANAAVAGFADGSIAYRVNPETGKFEKREVKKAPPPVKNEFPPEDDDEEDDDEEEMKKKMMEKETTNRRRRSKLRTVDDWLAAAPPEVQNTYRVAAEAEQREREDLIERLLVNVADVNRPQQKARLMTRSVQELRADVALIPAAPISEPAANRRGGRKVSQEADDVLPLPAMNWEEVGSSKSGKPAPMVLSENEDGDESGIDEEWLKSAPASVRRKIANASAYEEQERSKLIDELTENIADEEEERQAIAQLRRLSVESLRGLLPVKGRSPRPNYFGAAAPLPPATNRQSSNPTEDVLPLPTMNWEEVRKQA